MAMAQGRTPHDQLLCTVSEAGMENIKPFAVAAILEDKPTHSLCRGQVGTVVEPLAPRVFQYSHWLLVCLDFAGAGFASVGKITRSLESYSDFFSK